MPATRVVTLDLRGHGDSERPAPEPGVYSVERFADDVSTVVADAGWSQPVVVGHSLGGLVALELARRPNCVRAAVLVDPAPVVSPKGKAYFAHAVESVAADEDGSWRRRFASRLFAPHDHVRREEIIETMASLPTAVAAAGVQAMADYDGAAALEQVEVPMLAVYAQAPEPEIREHCEAVVEGQTVGAGHFNHLQVPNQVNAMIERFLHINGLV